MNKVGIWRTTYLPHLVNVVFECPLTRFADLLGRMVKCSIMKNSSEQPYKIHYPIVSQNNSNLSSGSIESSNTLNSESSEFKPCGVLKKPGSYRSHAGLKKVAFLENTELNRSTLWNELYKGFSFTEENNKLNALIIFSSPYA